MAAFVPIYFGRVGSLVIENRRLSDEQAEERVERQAREFELLKPYLVERWRRRRRPRGRPPRARPPALTRPPPVRAARGAAPRPEKAAR